MLIASRSVISIIKVVGEKHQQRQLLRIVKLTTIILLMACLAASARGLTQTLTLNVKNAPLEKVFEEIKKQTGYRFVYAMDLNEKAKNITLHLRNVTIEEALKKCFEGQPFTYKIINKVVIVNTKEEEFNRPKENATDDAPLLDISGKVTDMNGNPLQGATVKVKGSNKITTTNGAGVFVLKGVDNNATLEISFVGYEPLSVSVNNRTSVSAALKLNVVINPEVIINKGYYTEKQKTSVSNVGKITGDVIEKQPVNNVLLALQARVPGLFIMQPSGLAGNSVRIRIQGQNSLANGNDPLYVIDGVPIDPQLPGTGLDGVLSGVGANFGAGANFSGYGNPLSYINPNDIESIEVLKDADATAIYGSRAANGAILITTKKGKAGPMKLDLDMQTGWGKMTRRLNMLNTRQYLDMRYEAFANDGIDWTSPSVSANDLKVWDTTSYTNWQDKLLGGTANYTNFNASVSGGSPNVRYLVSGTYHKETTVFPLPNDFADKKGSVHFNLNAASNNQKIKMQFSGSYMVDDNQLPRIDITQNALLLEPNAPPLLNADGSINWAPDANGNTTLDDANIMIQQYQKYINKTYNLVSSLKLDYAILPGLSIGSSLGYNYMQTNDFSPQPLIAVAPELRATVQRSAAFGNRNLQSWIIEPQANYHTKFNKGIMDVLLGSTFQNKTASSNYLIGKGQLSDDLLDNINAAATITKGLSSSSSYRYNALFGRANYNWDDKYIVSINARRDGSTRFGGANRFHNFGSAGLAWVFSNEKFFKSSASFISFGKLRGSYGTTGSDQIGDYQFMSLYNLYSNAPVPYQGIVGLTPAGLPNPNLQWEETKKLQAGIDLGLLQDKIVFNTNFVRNRSSNQLLLYTLPTTAGFTSYYVNFPATIQNQSWEFLLTGKILQKKNLSWTSSANLTIPQNKLIRFPGLANSSYANILVVGAPIDATGYYHWLGVAAGTGDYLFADKNGHLTLSPDLATDRTVLISKFPKFYGGFDNSITYKSIQIDFIFQFVKQNGYNDVAFWNGIKYPGMFARGYSNQPITVLDRWQKPEDNASVAKYGTISFFDNMLSSDHRFADASYIRLKNLSISWNLPQKWVNKAHFRNFGIYLHGQNLLTITGYKGLDPETQSLTSLPPLQIWTVGVQAGL